MIKSKKCIISIMMSLVLMISLFAGMSSEVFADARYVPDAIDLTIYAGISSQSSFDNGDFGHAYISVENFTQRPITVGKLSVPANNGVSVGIWNNKEHKGVYYNLEFKMNDRDYWSYSTTITESQLVTLNSYILNNNTWNAYFNCSVFAAQAWNKVAKPQFASSYLSTPQDLSRYIQSLSGASHGRITSASFGKVYYLNNGTPKLSGAYN